MNKQYFFHLCFNTSYLCNLYVGLIIFCILRDIPTLDHFFFCQIMSLRHVFCTILNQIAVFCFVLCFFVSTASSGNLIMYVAFIWLFL